MLYRRSDATIAPMLRLKAQSGGPNWSEDQYVPSMLLAQSAVDEAAEKIPAPTQVPGQQGVYYCVSSVGGGISDECPSLGGSDYGWYVRIGAMKEHKYDEACACGAVVSWRVCVGSGLLQRRVLLHDARSLPGHVRDCASMYRIPLVHRN